MKVYSDFSDILIEHTQCVFKKFKHGSIISIVIEISTKYAPAVR